jgi:hypothetical protein
MPNHGQVSAGLKVSNQGSTIALRLPEKVMTLEHMGAMFPHRLSFVRLLLRRVKRENWQFSRPVWRMNADGYGVAVYSFKGPKRTYSLVAFSNELAPEHRTDRVIATAWDASFTLYDGLPSEDDIARLAANVPLQEAGRISESELSLSRANKSLRLFDHVVDRLAAGLQPDYEIVSSVGYLFRTTAVYGSGKMGAADFEKTGTYPGLAGPFQAEMLVVYLIREFSLDLVEHVATMRAPKKAVVLTDYIRRQFGVGNSTGLGMAPFLVNHPAILNQWMLVRETALARVRDLPIAGQKDQLMAYASTFRQRVSQWQTDDVAQTHRNQLLCDDMDKLSAFLHTLEFANFTRWNEVYEWSERHLSIDGQEGLISLLIEMNGPAVDDLEGLYDVNELNSFFINGLWRIGDVVAALDSDYAWAFDFNFDDPNEMARFWYVSEEKLEPRLGERWHEQGSERELPLGVARAICELRDALSHFDMDSKLAEFLLLHPEHRHTCRRLQLHHTRPYSEICDNILSAKMRPIDLLRFKLACFGALRFDPRSDRWLRISLYQNAPFARELQKSNDTWMFPIAATVDSTQ